MNQDQPDPRPETPPNPLGDQWCRGSALTAHPTALEAGAGRFPTRGICVVCEQEVNLRTNGMPLEHLLRFGTEDEAESRNIDERANLAHEDLLRFQRGEYRPVAERGDVFAKATADEGRLLPGEYKADWGDDAPESDLYAEWLNSVEGQKIVRAMVLTQRDDGYDFDDTYRKVAEQMLRAVVESPEFPAFARLWLARHSASAAWYGHTAPEDQTFRFPDVRRRVANMQARMAAEGVEYEFDAEGKIRFPEVSRVLSDETRKKMAAVLDVPVEMIPTTPAPYDEPRVLLGDDAIPKLGSPDNPIVVDEPDEDAIPFPLERVLDDPEDAEEELDAFGEAEDLTDGLIVHRLAWINDQGTCSGCSFRLNIGGPSNRTQDTVRLRFVEEHRLHGQVFIMPMFFNPRLLPNEMQDDLQARREPERRGRPADPDAYFEAQYAKIDDPVVVLQSALIVTLGALGDPDPDYQQWISARAHAALKRAQDLLDERAVSAAPNPAEPAEPTLEEARAYVQRLAQTPEFQQVLAKLRVVIDPSGEMQ